MDKSFKNRVIVFSVLLVVLFMGVAYGSSLVVDTEYDLLALLVATDPQDVWSNGSDFWVVDSLQDKVYHANSTFGLITEYEIDTLFGSASGVGIWGNDSNFWVSDGNLDVVFYLNSTFGHIANYSVSSFYGAGNPSGITGNGSNFWLVDRVLQVITYTNSTFGHIANYSVSDCSSAGQDGISLSGTSLWVTDSSNDDLCEFNLTGGTLNVYDLNALGITDATGIYAVNSTAFYITDGNARKSYYLLFQDTPPNITFISPTPADGSTSLSTDIYVNVSSSDSDGDHYTFLDFDMDLHLWIRMDDYNTTDFTDLSSYSNNGTQTGTIIVNSSAVWGNASWFDGDSGDKITINGLNASSVFADSFSVSGWIHTVETDTVNQFDIVGTETTAASQLGWKIMRTQNNQKIAFQGYNGSVSELASTDAIVDNQWYHFAMVYDSSSPSVSMYLNGVLNVTETTTASSTGYANLQPLEIGSIDLASRAVNGSIDDIVVFNRTLTATEVQALYNATATQYERNFTNLQDDTNHNFIAHAVDTAGNKNSTETRTILVQTDAVSPLVTINSPSEGFSDELPIFINITLNEAGSVNFTVDGGTTNTSLSTSDNLEFTGQITSSETGAIVLNIYATDDAGNNNFTEFRNLVVFSGEGASTGASPSPPSTTPSVDRFDYIRVDIDKTWFIGLENKFEIFTFTSNDEPIDVETIGIDFLGEFLDTNYTSVRKGVGEYEVEVESLNVTEGEQMRFILTVSDEFKEIREDFVIKFKEPTLFDEILNTQNFRSTIEKLINHVNNNLLMYIAGLMVVIATLVFVQYSIRSARARGR